MQSSGFLIWLHFAILLTIDLLPVISAHEHICDWLHTMFSQASQGGIDDHKLILRVWDMDHYALQSGLISRLLQSHPWPWHRYVVHDLAW